LAKKSIRKNKGKKVQSAAMQTPEIGVLGYVPYAINAFESIDVVPGVHADVGISSSYYSTGSRMD